MDKYLILIYLIQKNFRHYADTFQIVSEETMYSFSSFEIEKINLIEISESLRIPKETVRRKINELSKEGIIERTGKRITLKNNAFNKQRPVQTIKTLTSFLSICIKMIADESNIVNETSKVDIENFIRKNFSLVWRFFFETQIPNLVDWRNYYGDLETWIVTATVLINQSHKLRDLYKGKGITLDFDQMTNEEKFNKVYDFIFSNSEKIVGVNASSIAEITGVPRATVIRKLKYATKIGIITKDKKQLYLTKRMPGPKMKNFSIVAQRVTMRVYKFIATFIEIYKNKEQLPGSK